MTITVTGPDNVTVMFPDGIDPSIVHDVMSRAAATPKTSPITTNSLVREAATGVPIVGGLLNKLEAGTNALLSYGLNPLFDEKDQLTGSLGERYSKSLAEQNAMDEQFEREHPVASTAAQLLGGTAATLPVAATARGTIRPRRCAIRPFKTYSSAFTNRLMRKPGAIHAGYRSGRIRN
jgi:hypothetical protein